MSTANGDPGIPKHTEVPADAPVDLGDEMFGGPVDGDESTDTAAQPAFSFTIDPDVLRMRDNLYRPKVFIPPLLLEGAHSTAEIDYLILPLPDEISVSRHFPWEEEERINVHPGNSDPFSRLSWTEEPPHFYKDNKQPDLSGAAYDIPADPPGSRKLPFLPKAQLHLSPEVIALLEGIRGKKKITLESDEQEPPTPPAPDVPAS